LAKAASTSSPSSDGEVEALAVGGDVHLEGAVTGREVTALRRVDLELLPAGVPGQRAELGAGRIPVDDDRLDRGGQRGGSGEEDGSGGDDSSDGEARGVHGAAHFHPVSTRTSALRTISPSSVWRSDEEDPAVWSQIRAVEPKVEVFTLGGRLARCARFSRSCWSS
jgi:hypothetical protein